MKVVIIGAGAAGGITAAMFFGLIAALIFRGKPK